MKKHLSLLLLLLAFVLPVIAAKLVLENHWYQGGVTNRGQLLEQPVVSDWLAKPGKWQLIYLLPDMCDTRCQGALFNLRQVPLAMGAELERISSLVLVSAERSAALPDASSLVSGGGVVLAAPGPVLRQFQKLEQKSIGAIYIADPQGNVMMAYPLVEGKTQVLAQGKDILRDLKRLLKVSKIG
ncbi:cytochrome oxidase [Photobacterium sp. CCB-ST2H9]|uniref:cytochrome oxidase n=1 Tax=Photobacterium sp. CCB-ST2H9 TaxID=2912855 RepID=UPI002004A1A8|nr:cytochrome oxidase [Photobacterium sp. CCB-ST2H9]UTM57449.1 cytochrome oxidase [Photobacterium sp. CCB-ST2H9]